MAGMVLNGIPLRFAWQMRYLWDWAGSEGALGRREAAALLRGSCLTKFTVNLRGRCGT